MFDYMPFCGRYDPMLKAGAGLNGAATTATSAAAAVAALGGLYAVLA